MIEIQLVNEHGECVGPHYLLIDILEEPDAHQIAKMLNPEDKKHMEDMADVAEAFIHDGSVIA